MATLPLAITVGTTDTTITVIGTLQNIDMTDIITIGTEQISYTGASSNQFLNCVRGANSTTPAAHVRGVAVTYTQNPVVTLPISQPGVTPIPSYPWTTINVGDGIVEIQDVTAPTDSVTGKDIAPVGARYTNVATGQLYLNTGTQTLPVWTLLQAGSDAGITQLTGDVTAGPGNGSQLATLSTVNGNVGSFTSANITVDAKGRITAAANGSGATPAGSDTQIQYNSMGVFGASANLTFDGAAVLIDNGGAIRINGNSGGPNEYTQVNGGHIVISEDSGSADPYLLLSDLTGATLTVAVDHTSHIANFYGTSNFLLAQMPQSGGFVPTLMTTVQKNAIVSPIEGTTVYDTTLHKLCVFTGMLWETVTSA